MIQVSYDDTIYKTTVLTRVQLKEVPEEPHRYYMPTKCIKETQKLLKESVQTAADNPVLSSSEEEEVQNKDDSGMLYLMFVCAINSDCSDSSSTAY